MVVQQSRCGPFHKGSGEDESIWREKKIDMMQMISLPGLMMAFEMTFLKNKISIYHCLIHPNFFTSFRTTWSVDLLLFSRGTPKPT